MPIGKEGLCMTTREKPILHYTETIVNLYPEDLWDSLQELSGECEKIDSDSHFRKAFDSVIEKVYREGFKDGLALSAWLENGTPDHRL